MEEGEFSEAREDLASSRKTTSMLLPSRPPTRSTPTRSSKRSCTKIQRPLDYKTTPTMLSPSKQSKSIEILSKSSLDLPKNPTDGSLSCHWPLLSGKTSSILYRW